MLIEAAENECQKKVKAVKDDIVTFREFLLKISEEKTYHYTLWVLGEDTDQKNKMYFDLLEKAGLIRSKKGYSDQSGYLEYSLTDKGENMVQKIKKN